MIYNFNCWIIYFRGDFRNYSSFYIIFPFETFKGLSKWDFVGVVFPHLIIDLGFDIGNALMMISEIVLVIWLFDDFMACGVTSLEYAYFSSIYFEFEMILGVWDTSWEMVPRELGKPSIFVDLLGFRISFAILWVTIIMLGLIFRLCGAVMGSP